MKILFITDRNLIHDIRVYREIKLATELGHTADYIAGGFDGWTYHIESEHKKSSGARNGFYLKDKRINRIPAKILSRIAKLIYPFVKQNLALAAYSSHYITILIQRKLSQLNEKYDLIVAHGYRTLYPVAQYASKEKIPFGFDAASFIFEPDITEDDRNETEKRKLILRRILPKARYFTYTYDLIGQRIKEILEGEHIPVNFELLNGYYQDLFEYRENNDEKINFVWISKRIDIRSGLQLALPALEVFSDKIRLHIFGQATRHFFANVYKHYSDFIILHPPLTLKDLTKAVCKMDIGLSVLLPYISPALDFTLTNKVFLFAQAGLYTIASKTEAQKKFYTKYPELGKLSDSNLDDLVAAIEEVIKDIDNIRKNKKVRFDISKRFAWDNEKEKLAKILSEVQDEING